MQKQRLVDKRFLRFDIAAFRIALCFILSFLIAPSLFAQTTSTIQGAVTDKQGLAVSGAELRLSGDTIGTSRTVTS
ncbi:MAG TPA: hypothetical protein VE077_18365, partial [Candidatus Methylomirabilis sp.]|nr:hypothetical protein [Candidatus Methylomirabilis sp.]